MITSKLSATAADVATAPPSGPESAPSVIDVWSHIEPRYGGVGPAAGALATEVQRISDFQSYQVAVCNAHETVLADGISPTALRIPLSGFRPISDLRLRPLLSTAIRTCSICHVHGMWFPATLAARKIAADLGKPVVSSVHGTLEAWELKNKSYKKRPYGLFLERPSLARSSCLRALSEKEAGEYRAFGLKNPIAVVPTGIGRFSRTDTAPLLARFPQLRSKQVVLYLSRVHHKKGVLNLIQSWRSVASKHADSHLLVIGADFEGTTATAKHLISQYGLEKAVTFTGVVTPSEKQQALSLARYFCLPSYSEGLSAAVLEALSIGLPVIITPACNVDGVESGGAGYVVSNNPPELGEAISEALSREGSAWDLMSNAAKVLALTKYDWSIIGTQMLSVYQWLLGGPKPACVLPW